MSAKLNPGGWYVRVEAEGGWQWAVSKWSLSIHENEASEFSTEEAHKVLFGWAASGYAVRVEAANVLIRRDNE